MFRQSKRSDAGDTIVEVMISLVIISSILLGALVLSRTSSHDVRTAEERTQALNLLQGQVEQLRGIAPETLGSAFPATFCMYNSAITPSTSGNCTQSIYTLSIDKGATEATSKNVVFTASAAWIGVDGQQKYAQLNYRPPVKNHRAFWPTFPAPTVIQGFPQSDSSSI